VSTAKPLPCPFCGGSQVSVFSNTVCCNDPACGATGPDLGHVVGKQYEAQAVAKWNARAITLQAPTQMETK
jgi:hypothetical protein